MCSLLSGGRTKVNHTTSFMVMSQIYDFKSLTSRGKELDFAQFRGKVLLVVNTASKCGFTPQFAGLEELNKKYKDRGLVVIGFPCNQFKEQDPGSDGQIEEFCQLNYGVSFQIMKKTDVNGAAAEPIFQYLKTQAPTEEYSGLKAKAAKALFKTLSKSVEKDSDIKWNFTKFLVSRDGGTVKRYAPTTTPAKMEQDIEEMLG
jgi:glutathione peroxidase